MPATDLIVIGASAGGVGALLRMAGDLPAGWSAAVAVVIHLAPGSSSNLPQLLGARTRLPSSFAVNGETIEPARIYVAPPDHHLIVVDGAFRLSHGPKENRHRPSIDALFASASRSFDSRLIGVVLSGQLDDGTLGLAAVRDAGGITVVQDPADAEYPSMPTSALETVGPDHCVPVTQMGALLEALVRRKDDKRPGAGARRAHDAQSAHAAQAPRGGKGTPSVFGCPDCGGVLWEMPAGGIVRYECRVGHVYSPDGLLDRQEITLEDALWAGARALEEQTDLAERLAKRARARGQHLVAERFEERARAAAERAGLVRAALQKAAAEAAQVRSASAGLREAAGAGSNAPAGSAGELQR